MSLPDVADLGDECEHEGCSRRWTHVSFLLDYATCEEHTAVSSHPVRSVSAVGPTT